MVRQREKNIPDLVFRTCLQNLLVVAQMDYPSSVLAESGRWAVVVAVAAEACLSSVLARRAHLSFVLEG